MRVFDVCANARSRGGATCDQPRALCSALNGVYGHHHGVPSCGAHGVCAHGDARVHVDAHVRGVLDDDVSY